MKKLITTLSLLSVLALVSYGQDKKSSDMFDMSRFSISAEFGKTKFKPDWKLMYVDNETGSFKTDKKDSMLLLGVNYKLTDMIFVSFEYINLGETSLKGKVYDSATVATDKFTGSFKYNNTEYTFDEGSNTATDGSLKLEFSGFGLGFGFIYPFADKFYGGLKVGLFFWDRKAKITGNIEEGKVIGSAATNDLATKKTFEGDDSDLYYSFILGYMISEQFNIYGGYSGFKMEDDKADSINIGVNFRF